MPLRKKRKGGKEKMKERLLHHMIKELIDEMSCGITTTNFIELAETFYGHKLEDEAKDALESLERLILT